MSDADRFPFRESTTATEDAQPRPELKEGGTRRYSQLYSGITGSVNFKFTEFHVSYPVRPMD
jgi:hypothetical protein